jgi:hypothetical protein
MFYTVEIEGIGRFPRHSASRLLESNLRELVVEQPSVHAQAMGGFRSVSIGLSQLIQG